MIKEFKEFMMRGSVIDLAVGVVIGSAFTAIVNGIVSGLITPLINLIFVLILNKDQEDVASGMVYQFKGVDFNVGAVVTAIITFIITAFVLFIIVKGINKMKNFRKKEEIVEEAAAPSTEDYLIEIRDLLAEQNKANGIKKE